MLLLGKFTPCVAYMCHANIRTAPIEEVKKLFVQVA